MKEIVAAPMADDLIVAAPRWLRPFDVVVTSEGVWLTDISQPVAVVLDLQDGRVTTIVDWRDTALRDGVHASRSVIADGAGIVVQEGGPVNWVSPAGVIQSVDPGSLILAAVHDGSAWLIDTEYPRIEGPQPDGAVVLVHRDGSRDVTVVDRPVLSVCPATDSVVLVVSDDPVSRGDERSSEYAYPSRTIEVGRPLPARIVTAQFPRLDEPAAIVWPADEVYPRVRRFVSPPRSWSASEIIADSINRRVKVVGLDTDTNAEAPIFEVDLGVGIAGGGSVVGGELWLTVVRERWLAVDYPAPAEVIAIDGDGRVRTVLGPDSIDIAGRCRPLNYPGELQVRRHVEAVLAQQVRDPLRVNDVDVDVAVAGQWPETQLVITVESHRSRPGVRLRRVVPLFDEFGRPLDSFDCAAITLEEDLATGYLPPLSEAVNGVLKF